MKKILLIAALAAFAWGSCVKDEKWDAGEPVEDADYTGLVLNEINGSGADADKYIELFNTSGAEIELNGVEITYNGTVTWTGQTTHKIASGGFLVLQGSKGTGDMSQGLSAGKNIRVELRTPSGELIDFFQRGNADGNDVTGGLTTGESYSRIPNGYGAFYFAGAGTKGAANATGGANTLVESDVPNVPNFSMLKINEVDGTNKFVEMYNMSVIPMSLTGLTLVKNESGTWWTGGAVSIAAGGFYAVGQNGNSTAGVDEFTGASGISAKQNLKFELKNGTAVIDSFLRSNGGALGASVTPAYDGPDGTYSFSRTPDGSGEFGLATPSPGAANPETAAGPIVTNP